jgi:hypothetical protein
MTLIICNECKKEVSDTAKSCPNCGAKVTKKLSFLRGAFNLVMISAIAFMVVGYLSNKEKAVQAEATTDQPAPPTEEIIKILSTALAREYDKNEAKADSIFKNKVIMVKGNINSIEKDVSDNTVVMLSGINQFSHVHASVQKSEEEKAINLKKGQELIVQCIGNGEVVGSPMLTDCIIIQ